MFENLVFIEYEVYFFTSSSNMCSILVISSKFIFVLNVLLFEINVFNNGSIAGCEVFWATVDIHVSTPSTPASIAFNCVIEAKPLV